MCSFDVVVNDNELPTFGDCPSSNVVVFADATCEATYTAPSDVDNNCAIATAVTCDNPSPLTGVATTAVECSVQDTAGLTGESAYLVVWCC
jgi:hypothetical protein